MDTLLNDKFNMCKEYYVKFAHEKQLLENELLSLSVEIANTTSSIATLEAARLFMQKVSEEARNNAKVRIEHTVTNALQYVFGEKYSFQIDIRNTNTRPEADFIVLTEHNGEVLRSMPLTDKGGGIIDLLAVALKCSLLEILNYDGPIWIDEPFKQVSQGYRENVSNLIQYLQETSGRQFIIITHDPQFAEMCEQRILVTQVNGVSHAELTGGTFRV